MVKQRPIELLAPAKNLECGIEAINHGADAVYIGAPRFGARAAAGNSLEDIAALVKDEFGEKAEPLYPRIVKYFQIMESYHFVNFINKPEK